jgi:hypothetical protein
MFRKWMLLGGLLVTTTTLLVGCNGTPSPVEKPDEPKAAEVKPEGDHAHKPGAHGGTLVSLGKDSYHAEAVFAKNGVVRLYMLGKDESRIQEVEVQELVGYVTVAGSTDAAVEVKFPAERQKGDPEGKTSLFVGQLPPDLAGKAVQVTINNIRIGAERFRIAFSNEKADHDDPMPPSVGSEEARKLYLTPGGKYAEADIKANGNTIPAAKFKGIKSDHNAKPQPGDKICPISMSKANPKFTWVVGGKTYEFCCVPCIDEFMQTAKDKPNEIKDPSEYFKK